MRTFYLGTHEEGWLARGPGPWFISRIRLVRRPGWPRCSGVWALDSGAFSELLLHGKWTVAPAHYVGEVRRFREAIGGMAWAAIQDWMCEPSMLAKTGLTVAEHQRRTTDNYEELLSLAPEVPWSPVVQGWAAGDYLRHADEYRRRGLPMDRVVGVGSICRRQASDLRAGIAAVHQLAHHTGWRLHGFGVKVTGLIRMARVLESADSMAWSYRGRRAGRHAGCVHASGANCIHFALAWRDRLLREVASSQAQEALL